MIEKKNFIFVNNDLKLDRQGDLMCLNSLNGFHFMQYTSEPGFHNLAPLKF